MSAATLNTFLAPGMADTVEFSLHPAIRNGTGKSGDCATDSFSCPDEPCGCPYTRWMLCGLQAAKQEQVRFLTCYDSQNTPFSSDWVTFDEMPNPMQAAQQCAEDLGLNWTAIQSCGGNITGNVETGNYTEVVGAEGRQLAIEAANYFFDTFFRARSGVKFYVPNLYIENQAGESISQDLENLDDMWNITKALCAAGATADICEVAHDAGNPDWFGDAPREVEEKHSHHDHTKKMKKYSVLAQDVAAVVV